MPPTYLTLSDYEVCLMIDNGLQSACQWFTGIHRRVYMAGIFPEQLLTYHLYSLKPLPLYQMQVTMLDPWHADRQACARGLPWLWSAQDWFWLFCSHQYCQISYRDAVHRQVVSGQATVWRMTGVDESTRVWKSSFHFRCQSFYVPGSCEAKLAGKWLAE